MQYNEATRTIETERLILRPFTHNDTTAVVTHCRNENVSRNTLALPQPYSDENFTSWLTTHEDDFNANRLFNFAITLKAGDELIGSISVSHIASHHRGELGYWLGEPFWNKGFGTEAANALLFFAFNYTELNRVYAQYMVHNQNSANIMKKIGMKHEGILKQQFYVAGEYIDAGLCAIVKEDYLKLQ